MQCSTLLLLKICDFADFENLRNRRYFQGIYLENLRFSQILKICETSQIFEKSAKIRRFLKICELTDFSKSAIYRRF